MHDQRAPGDVAGGEDVRHGRAQLRVDLDVSAPVRLHARPGRGPARRWRRPIRPRPRPTWRRCCCCPSLVEWMSRTPVAQRSKRSIVPASSTTWTPDAAMAAVTASETSWSSLIRMRGAISTRWTREPNALKIDATCTPVAPAPITSSDGGTEERCHASLCVAVRSKPGTASGREVPPVQRMTLSARSRGALSLSTVWASANRAGAGLLVDAHPGALQIVAQQRVLACVRGHVADAGQQPGVVERGFAARDPVERELPGLADQPRRLGQRAHRHGPVVRGHSAELIAGDQRRRWLPDGPHGAPRRHRRVLRRRPRRRTARRGDEAMTRSSGVPAAARHHPCRVRRTRQPGATMRMCAR